MDVLAAARRARQVLQTAQGLVEFVLRLATERPAGSIQSPVLIPRNTLLKSAGPTLDLDTAEMMRALAAEAVAEGSEGSEGSDQDSMRNLAQVSDVQLAAVDRHYGPPGGLFISRTE